MNGSDLPYDAQRKPIKVAMSLRKNTNRVCSITRRTLHTISAPATGARQYPNTHTDWKNDLKDNSFSKFDTVILHIGCIDS